MKEALKGITLNGIDLAQQLKSESCPICTDVDDQVSKDVSDEFNRNHHIYKHRNHKFPNQQGKRSKPMEKWSEVNKRNMRHNVVCSIMKNDMKKAIMSIILSLDEFKTLTEMFDMIKDIAKSEGIEDKLRFSNHSLRAPLGLIMKTEFPRFLDVLSFSRASRKYRINEVYKDKFSVDMAMNLINSQLDEIHSRKLPNNIKKETEAPKQDELNPLASFNLPTENGILEVKVFGKIQFEFTFK